MSNMSILDSRRGITEAEDVTKLTELAFLFIPVGFSATIFGMQVDEFRSGVHIWTFVILAVVLTTSSYGLRLLIRSEIVITLKRRTLAEIRAHADLGVGDRIPNSAYFSWIWATAGPTTLLMLVFLAVIGGSLAGLWARNMNRGYQTVISLVVVFSALGIAAVTLLHSKLWKDVLFSNSRDSWFIRRVARKRGQNMGMERTGDNRFSH